MTFCQSTKPPIIFGGPLKRVSEIAHKLPYRKHKTARNSITKFYQFDDEFKKNTGGDDARKALNNQNNSRVNTTRYKRQKTQAISISRKASNRHKKKQKKNENRWTKQQTEKESNGKEDIDKIRECRFGRRPGCAQITIVPQNK